MWRASYHKTEDMSEMYIQQNKRKKCGKLDRAKLDPAPVTKT